MSGRKKFRPHIMRIESTVGECGGNKPEEVLWFQQTLSESGYQELTGRDVKITGQCDKDTIDGIRWFQNMLSMKPTGMIHPETSGFRKR
ncbi:peptidoglycan-binding domain-containing protein [Cronobacter sakazakii]